MGTSNKQEGPEARATVVEQHDADRYHVIGYDKPRRFEELRYRNNVWDSTD
jgi:hypothetical protein